MGRHESAVLELQRMASGDEVDVRRLLRHAKVIARKLSLTEFEQWVDREMNGYFGEREVPAYRSCRAQVRLRNPYHGLIPVSFPDSALADIFCLVKIRDPIGNLCALVEEGKGEGELLLPLAPEQERWLYANQDGLAQLPPVRTIGRNQVFTVIEAVRNGVLEWALRLEKEGILGEGMQFSEAERNKASENPSISIAQFQGILGDVSGSGVSQSFGAVVGIGDLEGLTTALRELGVSDAEIDDLHGAIDVDDSSEGRASQKKLGPAVKEWVGKAIAKAMDGSYKVGTAVAAKVIERVLLSYYGLT